MAAAFNPYAPAYAPIPLLRPPSECCYSFPLHPSSDTFFFGFNPFQSYPFYFPAAPTPPPLELYRQYLSPQIIYSRFPHNDLACTDQVLPNPLPLPQPQRQPQPQAGVSSTPLSDEEGKQVSEKPQDDLAVQQSDCKALKGRKNLRGFGIGGDLAWRRKGFATQGMSKRRAVQTRHKKKAGVEFEFSKLEIGAGDGERGKTSVMIKNLPNKFTKEKLLGILDQHCFEENQKLQKDFDKNPSESGESEFDFLYLPIDFKSGSNLGYAFVNFTSATAARRLYNSLHNYAWKSHGSSKVCAVTYARVQGLPALLRHFRSSVFVCESDNFLPVCFLPPRNGNGQCKAEERYIGKRIPVSPEATAQVNKELEMNQEKVSGS